MGVAKAERIPFDPKCLAITDRWGLVQTYLLPKERIIQAGKGSNPEPISILSNQELQLIKLAWEIEAGKVFIPKLMEWATTLGLGGE